MRYDYGKVEKSIQKNNGIFSSNITTIQANVAGISNCYANGKALRSDYESVKQQLEAAKNAALETFNTYGPAAASGHANFATPSISNGEDTHNNKDCCSATQRVIDLANQLGGIYSRVEGGASATEAGFFDVDIDSLIEEYNALSSIMDGLINEGKEILFKVRSKDNLLNPPDPVIDSAISTYYSNISALKGRFATYKQLISEIKDDINTEKGNFESEHEDTLNISEITGKHVGCHCDSVTVGFCDDPTKYSQGGSYSGTPTEITAYKGYSFEQCGVEVPEGNEVENGDRVVFMSWNEFTSATPLDEDRTVTGTWKIWPQVAIIIEGEYVANNYEIGGYNMFESAEQGAENCANDFVAQKNEDTENEEYEYSVLTRPDDYIVTAENYTLPYTIKKELKKHTVSIYSRLKTGPDSYGEYKFVISSLVEHGYDYIIDSSHTAYASALENGLYIDPDHTLKTETGEQTSKDITQDIIADVRLNFNQIALYKAEYKNKNDSVADTVQDIEAYTAFDVSENIPDGWPENPIIEDGIMYILCAEPYTYKIEGGPIDCVTSNITITPNYGNGYPINAELTASIKLCTEIIPSQETEPDGTVIIHDTVRPPVEDETTIAANEKGIIEVSERRKFTTFKENFLKAVRENYAKYAEEDAEWKKVYNDNFTPTKIYEPEDIKKIEDISFGESLFGSSLKVTDLNDPSNTLETIVFASTFSDIIELVVFDSNTTYKPLEVIGDMLYDLGVSQHPANPRYIKNRAKASYEYDKKRSDYNNAILIVDREPYSLSKKNRELLNINGYEKHDVITVPIDDPNGKKAIISQKYISPGDGDRTHFIGAVLLPYAHFVYGDSTPNKELKGKEICDPYQFDPRENGEFVPSSSPREFAGYTGHWTEANQAGNPYRAPIEKITDKNFFSDVTFTYEYKGMPAVVYEYVIDPSVQPEDKSAINTAYNNDTSSDGGTITCDDWTPGYQYNKANFLTNFGESITYEIKPDELPTEISDTYHATITYYGYYEYWDEGEYVENSGVVHFWGAYNSETETYSKPVELDITGTVGERWTSKIRMVGGQASIVEVTEHEISDTRTKQLPGTSPMDVGGQSFNWWWEDENGNHYTPGSSITIPVNDQPIETASRVITIVGGQVIANAHTDGPVAELNLLRVLDI